jgi:hypothetical protein
LSAADLGAERQLMLMALRELRKKSAAAFIFA